MILVEIETACCDFCINTVLVGISTAEWSLMMLGQDQMASEGSGQYKSARADNIANRFQSLARSFPYSMVWAVKSVADPDPVWSRPFWHDPDPSFFYPNPDPTLLWSEQMVT